ncbi:MAG: hypothetical protein J4F33_08875 [Alphaproteobacteria bacterium]|nr:hypothetical protein [Alphaproteobacteria bacterium]
MGLSTYGELKTAVADWLDRPDLEARMPDLTALARARIHHGRGRAHAWPSPPLRLRAMEHEAPVELDESGVAALPDGFLGLIRVSGDGGRRLRFVTPEAFGGGGGGVYTVEGTAIRGTPAAVLRVRFYRPFPALAADGDSDWLLANAPEVHLYGVLLESAPYLRSDERLAMWATLYNGAIDGLMAADRAAARPAEGLAVGPEGATP